MENRKTLKFAKVFSGGRAHVPPLLGAFRWAPYLLTSANALYWHRGDAAQSAAYGALCTPGLGVAAGGAPLIPHAFSTYEPPPRSSLLISARTLPSGHGSKYSTPPASAGCLPPCPSTATALEPLGSPSSAIAASSALVPLCSSRAPPRPVPTGHLSEATTLTSRLVRPSETWRRLCERRGQLWSTSFRLGCTSPTSSSGKMLVAPTASSSAKSDRSLQWSRSLASLPPRCSSRSRPSPTSPISCDGPRQRGAVL